MTRTWYRVELWWNEVSQPPYHAEVVTKFPTLELAERHAKRVLEALLSSGRQGNWEYQAWISSMPGDKHVGEVLVGYTDRRKTSRRIVVRRRKESK